MSFLTALLIAAVATSSFARIPPRSAALSACQAVAECASSDASVYYPVDGAAFDDAILHWMNSSTQVPTCVYSPATSADVALALRVIDEYQVPFAVKGGGHASNPGYSSTTGLHISMAQFSQVKLSADKSTVELGFGLLWNTVYEALNGTGVNVVGGRVPGVGVAGFTLGGGYSWFANMYGLTIDTVVSYNLVLPNGTFTTVAAANKDLFWALKGGFNNYGIVTSAVYKTVPQPAIVYGGTRVYNGSETATLLTAIADFAAQNTDPRVLILPTLNANGGELVTQVLMFFNGPLADLPANSLQIFDGLPTIYDDVANQSFLSFYESFGSKSVLNGPARGVFNSISIQAITPAFLDQVANQTAYYAAQQVAKGGIVVSYDVEPFLTSPTQNLFTKSLGGAYPHSATNPLLPFNIFLNWASSDDDEFWIQASIDSVAVLKAAAIAEGQRVASAPVYPNYAVAGTSLATMYGSNVARMESIKKSVDPTNIMGLAGGIKVPV